MFSAGLLLVAPFLPQLACTYARDLYQRIGTYAVGTKHVDEMV
jgi:hypothetical protein